MNNQTYEKAIIHPLPITAAVIYLTAIVIVLVKGGNAIGMVILAMVMVLHVVSIVSSWQTGKLQMYQGHNATRQNDPQKYWFHFVTQTILWLVFNVVFGIACWTIIR